MLREMRGRQERRKTGRRRQETGEGGKDYQMRRWRSCGQHPIHDKGKREREIDPKHDKPNHLLHCPLSFLNNTERKIVLAQATATCIGLKTLTLELSRKIRYSLAITVV